MRTPRLTIAIPTVNRANLLGRTIESALAQTSPEVEVIVSNNGSTDNTPEVMARYEGRPGLRMFRHETRMSAARHGQFLIEQARGEFFAGLSDDDLLEPEFAVQTLALLDRSPELSFVYTNCAVNYGEIEVVSMVGPEIESGADFLTAHYAGKREVCWCACVTRVRLLRKFGPQPDERTLGDMFFWTKMAFEGPVGCVPRVLSRYILLRSQSENDNISHGTSPVAWGREERLLADEVLEAVHRAGKDPEYIHRLEKYIRRYVARSTANQFVWTRIRGASWKKTFAEIGKCRRYLSWSPLAWRRVTASVVLPPGLLRRLLIHFAGRRAQTRLKGGELTVGARVASGRWLNERV